MASAFATTSFRSAESSLISDSEHPDVDGHVMLTTRRSYDAPFHHITRGLNTCGLCIAYMLTITWSNPADFGLSNHRFSNRVAARGNIILNPRLA